MLEAEKLELILQRVSLSDDKLGSSSVTKIKDHFIVLGNHGPHTVIAVDALGPNLHTILRSSNQTEFHLNQVRSVSRQLLEAVLYSHEECSLIHGDIGPGNIMVEVSSDDLQKLNSPHSSKGETNFNVGFTNSKVPVKIRLGDFGLAYSFDEPPNRTIQTCTYRAPEVFLCSNQTSTVDIWSVGCVIYELLAKEPMFKCNGSGDRTIEWLGHLSQMQGFLGSLQRDVFLTRINSGYIARFFQSNGELRRNSIFSPLLMNARIERGRAMSKTNLDEAAQFIRSLLNGNPKLREIAKGALNNYFYAAGYRKKCSQRNRTALIRQAKNRHQDKR